MVRIGLLGLGRMGLPIARRLLQAGYDLKTCVHRNLVPGGEIKALGGSLCRYPEDVAAGSDVLLSLLPDDTVIHAVLLHPKLLASLNPGSILVEMSTGSPEGVRRVASEWSMRGCEVFDAPVSGGIKGAEEGTLTLIGGGEAGVLERLRPLLGVFSRRVFHVGPVGAGKAVKAVNQFLVAVNTLAVSEALRLARHLELDLERVFEVISASSGMSAMFAAKFKKMVQGDFSPSFTLALMKKDLRIALDEGENQPLPLGRFAQKLYLELVEALDTRDFSVVSTLFSDGGAERR